MPALKTAKRRVDSFLMLLSYARPAERPRLLLILIWHMLALFARRSAGRRRIIALNGFRLSVVPGRMSGLTFFVEVIVRDLYRELRGTPSGPGQLVILDAGANVGCFSLWAARRWPQALIIAVEPQPEAHADLLQNIAANGLQGRVVPLRLAVTEVAGRQVMHTHTEHNMATLVSYAATEPGEFATEAAVDCLSVDEIEQAQAVRFSLIKMDIEGGEGMALRGAAQTLAHAEEVILETHSEALHRECRALLAQSGLASIDANGLLYARRTGATDGHSLSFEHV